MARRRHGLRTSSEWNTKDFSGKSTLGLIVYSVQYFSSYPFHFLYIYNHYYIHIHKYIYIYISCCLDDVSVQAQRIQPRAVVKAGVIGVVCSCQSVAAWVTRTTWCQLSTKNYAAISVAGSHTHIYMYLH